MWTGSQNTRHKSITNCSAVTTELMNLSSLLYCSTQLFLQHVHIWKGREGEEISVQISSEMFPNHYSVLSHRKEKLKQTLNPWGSPEALQRCQRGFIWSGSTVPSISPWWYGLNGFIMQRLPQLYRYLYLFLPRKDLGSYNLSMIL